MKLDGKRLLICEEALISYTGHFYTWIKSIRKINLAAGAQVEVASNTEVEKPIADEFSAHRTYSKNNWSGVYHYTQAWKRYLGVFKHNKLVYTETKRLLKETEPIDCILLPAARIHHLIAWRFLCSRFLKSKFKRIVIFILTSEAVYNKDHTDFTFKGSANLIRLALKSFKKYVKTGEVLFAGDSHITCAEYERLAGVSFTVFPSPGVALAKSAETAESDEEKFSRGLVFVILGLSVFDKGIDLWQEAVLKYLRNHPDGKAKFIIQWGVKTHSYEGKEIPIHDELRNSPKVTLLERSLTDEEYVDYFQKSDFLSLPYRRKAYFNRISGVLIEAACSGIPMMVTENTWLSWAMEEYGAGVTVKDNDSEDLYQKLLYSVDNWRSLAKAAEAKRPIALEKNSSENYLHCLWEEGLNGSGH
jgi:glycosyltransferase involved in cell wall biosynthesis